MAVGSVGNYLNYNYEELGVFVSEDGGLTWRHIADGVHMYEIGDQGGLIVMTDFKRATDLVKFSYDLGRSWYFIKFLDPNQSKATQGKAIYKAIQVGLASDLRCLTSSWSRPTTTISS